MKAQSLTEASQNAVQYLRTEISALADQFDPIEKHTFHMKSLAVLMAIQHAGLLTQEEFETLGKEIGVANTQAAAQVARSRAK